MRQLTILDGNDEICVLHLQSLKSILDQRLCLVAAKQRPCPD